MISVYEVANYTLFFAYKRGDLLTNLKLQKLLYYIQAWFLVKNQGQPLFKENIEAWQYGPVVREIYDKYKCFGRNPINDEALTNELTVGDVITNHIDNVLNEYMDYSASSLVKSIHNDTPWIEAFSSKENPKIISLQSLYKYYKDFFISKDEMKKLIATPLEECITL